MRNLNELNNSLGKLGKETSVSSTYISESLMRLQEYRDSVVDITKHYRVYYKYKTRGSGLIFHSEIIKEFETAQRYMYELSKENKFYDFQLREEEVIQRVIDPGDLESQFGEEGE